MALFCIAAKVQEPQARAFDATGGLIKIDAALQRLVAFPDALATAGRGLERGERFLLVARTMARGSTWTWAARYHGALTGGGRPEGFIAFGVLLEGVVAPGQLIWSAIKNLEKQAFSQVADSAHKVISLDNVQIQDASETLETLSRSEAILSTPIGLKADAPKIGQLNASTSLSAQPDLFFDIAQRSDELADYGLLLALATDSLAARLEHNPRVRSLAFDLDGHASRPPSKTEVAPEAGAQVVVSGVDRPEATLPVDRPLLPNDRRHSRHETLLAALYRIEKSQIASANASKTLHGRLALAAGGALLASAVALAGVSGLVLWSHADLTKAAGKAPAARADASGPHDTESEENGNTTIPLANTDAVHPQDQNKFPPTPEDEEGKAVGSVTPGDVGGRSPVQQAYPGAHSAGQNATARSKGYTARQRDRGAAFAERQAKPPRPHSTPKTKKLTTRDGSAKEHSDDGEPSR